MIRKRDQAKPPFTIEVFPSGCATVLDSTGRTAWEGKRGAVLLASKEDAAEVLRILEAG